MNSVSAPAAPDDQQPALERARPAARAVEADLAAIYEARRGELLAFLVGMTRDREEAEDLLRDAVLRLVGHRPAD